MVLVRSCGVATGLFDEMDSWMAKLADRKVEATELLHQGEDWGAVEELRRGGQPLAAGSFFPPPRDGHHRDNLPPPPSPVTNLRRQLRNTTPPPVADTAGWVELVTTGIFSTAVWTCLHTRVKSNQF